MVQWFNKQKNSISLSKDQQTDSQDSSSLPVLEDEDYEFLFNQLLDGVAHGWHLGRILKFFQDLEPRSNSQEWISWIKKLETKVVYANDPSQRRVGAILTRLAEVTQSNDELREFGRIARRISRKLLVAKVQDLIWEYDGKDIILEAQKTEPELATEDNTQSLDSIENPTDNPTQTTLELENDSTETIEFIDRSSSDNVAEASEQESLVELESLASFTTQPTPSPDYLVAEPENLDLEEETEPENPNHQSTESIEEFTQQSTPTQNNQSLQSETLATAEQAEQTNQTIYFVPESVAQSENKADEEITKELNNSKSRESSTAPTEQSTILQDENSFELDVLPDEPNSELDLSTKKNHNTSSTPISVASFLEAAKALVPQHSNPYGVSLSWSEFVSVLEKDQALAQQVARHLKLSSSNPDDIVRAAVNRLTRQQEVAQLSPDTVKLVKDWFDLGLKQASAEDFQGAVASWDKALELNPHLSEAWHNRGSALGRLEKYEEAIKSFNQAIKIAPEHYQAWNDRAHALYQIQKWQQAIESWDKAISIMADNYQFWYNRGCALEQLQRYDESISSYEKTLEIKPDFQPARSRYISLVTERSSSASN